MTASVKVRRGSEGDVVRSDVAVNSWDASDYPKTKSAVVSREEDRPHRPAPPVMRSRASSGELDIMMERAVKNVVVSIPKSRQNLTPTAESPSNLAQADVDSRTSSQNTPTPTPTQKSERIASPKSQPQVPLASVPPRTSQRRAAREAHVISSSSASNPSFVVNKKNSPPVNLPRQNSTSSSSTESFYPHHQAHHPQQPHPQLHRPNQQQQQQLSNNPNFSPYAHQPQQQHFYGPYSALYSSQSQRYPNYPPSQHDLPHYSHFSSPPLLDIHGSAGPYAHAYSSYVPSSVSSPMTAGQTAESEYHSPSGAAPYERTPSFGQPPPNLRDGDVGDGLQQFVAGYGGSSEGSRPSSHDPSHPPPSLASSAQFAPAGTSSQHDTPPPLQPQAFLHGNYDYGAGVGGRTQGEAMGGHYPIYQLAGGGATMHHIPNSVGPMHQQPYSFPTPIHSYINNHHHLSPNFQSLALGPGLPGGEVGVYQSYSPSNGPPNLPLSSGPLPQPPLSPYRPVIFLPHPAQQAAYDAYLAGPPAPQPYSPAEHGLARGLLAQANFHDAIFGRRGNQRQSSSSTENLKGGGERKRTGRSSHLPKPPAHSPWAMWVGNVPSDSSHAELWRFFTLRPVPSSARVVHNLRLKGRQRDSKKNVIEGERELLVEEKGDEDDLEGDEDAAEEEEEVDLSSTGVISIHLIARSNCAFVNYASDIHLQHGITVSHGVCLRPFDSRCKDLVCRVRKREDDVKSGVGAQRTGGMHHAYLAANAKTGDEEEDEADDDDNSPLVMRNRNQHRESTGGNSVSTISTTSSFLARNFPRRFFVLKSHNEDDLRLSVERGLWATQSHNEPVLDQAFRGCKDGVYLFFSANKSGEWFGYARMASGVSTSQDRRVSWATTREHEASGSYNDTASRPPTIHEHEPVSLESHSLLFSPSEQRLADGSPLPLTPSGSGIGSSRARGDSAPAKMTAARAAMLTQSGEHVGANLHLPLERRGESLDPRVLDQLHSRQAADQAVLDQESASAASRMAELDHDGVWRKDTLPTAEERNARLDKLEDASSHDTRPTANGWGKPFKVEWIKHSRLPFARTRAIQNGFNANREIKISRDGTEVEPLAGEALIEEFWRDEGGIPPEHQLRTRPAAVASGMVV